MQRSEMDELRVLLEQVRLLRGAIVDAEARQAGEIGAVAARHRYSAANLVHYVELRRHDIRDLQVALSGHGLTSLGRTESQVLASIDGLLRTLTRLAAPDTEIIPPQREVPGGAELLSRNAVRLLGPVPVNRATRIMVTLPSAAASNPAWVGDMHTSGMDIARINCAHDGRQAWAAMIANIRSAEAITGTRCLVAMDLGGPKLRTGPIEAGPEVLRVKPLRNELGAVVEPALMWLGRRPGGVATVSVPLVPLQEGEWAGRRRAGEKIRLMDARGSRRTLTVEKVFEDACLASVRRTVYFVPGTVLSVGEDRPTRTGGSAHVGALAATDRSMLVRRGDQIVLTRDMTPAQVSAGGVHRIGCTLAEVFTDARAGEHVWLDDGKIGGVITGVATDELTVEVLSAGATATKLRAEKGINVPDTRLRIAALTEQDIVDLEFVKQHADIVNLSFVRTADDVRDLVGRLDSRDDQALGIVLKIETVAAFDSLPQILLEAMRWGDVGVMIARGDLAVEAGFERLAEVQEEILWLCEAAHVPVIWATQVLDTLARTGLPSRAEVTDAAMADRAECVMLNKGPFIDEAIAMLAGILGRMQDHTQKKRSLLRRLRAWDLDATETGQA